MQDLDRKQAWPVAPPLRTKRPTTLEPSPYRSTHPFVWVNLQAGGGSIVVGRKLGSTFALLCPELVAAAPSLQEGQGKAGPWGSVRVFGSIHRHDSMLCCKTEWPRL